MYLYLSRYLSFLMTCSFHLKNPPSGKAFSDFVRDIGWKNFIILYETEDGLVKMQELLKLPKTFADVKITLRQLTPGTDDYRPLLKEIKKSEITRIVLDCDFDKIAMILAQADEVGLLTDYHNYLGKESNKKYWNFLPTIISLLFW